MVEAISNNADDSRAHLCMELFLEVTRGKIVP